MRCPEMSHFLNPEVLELLFIFLVHKFYALADLVDSGAGYERNLAHAQVFPLQEDLPPKQVRMSWAI